MRRLLGPAIVAALLGLSAPGSAQIGITLGGGIGDPLMREELEGLRLGMLYHDAHDQLEGRGFHLSQIGEASTLGGTVGITAMRRERSNDYLTLLFCGWRLYDMKRRTAIGPDALPALDILYYGDGINYGHQLRYEPPPASGAPWWWETRTWDRYLCLE